MVTNLVEICDSHGECNKRRTFIRAGEAEEKEKEGETDCCSAPHAPTVSPLLFPSLGAGETFRNGMTLLLSLSQSQKSWHKFHCT